MCNTIFIGKVWIIKKIYNTTKIESSYLCSYTKILFICEEFQPNYIKKGYIPKTYDKTNNLTIGD